MMASKVVKKGNDDSAREEPGYGDENLSSGPIVDEQLKALGVLEADPADRESEESSIEEALKVTKASELQEEGEEEEVEAAEAEDEGYEEVEKLDEISESDSKEEEEEEEAVDGETSDEELSEVSQLRAQNAKLMELLNDQLASLEGKSDPAQEPTQEEEAPSRRLPLTIPKLPEVSQENLDEIISSADSFNKYMRSVFDAGQQSLFSMLPRIIDSQVDTRDVMNSFFRENKDLAPIHQYVKKLAIEIQNREPSANASIALNKAGKQARTLLGLGEGKQKEVNGNNKQRKPRRRFAPATSKRQGPTESSRKGVKKVKEDPNSIEAQIVAMERAGEKIPGG